MVHVDGCAMLIGDSILVGKEGNVFDIIIHVLRTDAYLVFG